MKQGIQKVLYEDKIYRIIYVRCENNEIFKENKMIVTKQARVLEALKSGEQLTAKQIGARFGVKNPTATISDIRLSGFAVYANKHTDTKGRVTTKYRLGTPSRAIVAAGYRAMALGLA
jgi:predicted ArsR family transcriptional regulator